MAGASKRTSNAETRARLFETYAAMARELGARIDQVGRGERLTSGQLTALRAATRLLETFVGSALFLPVPGQQHAIQGTGPNPDEREVQR